MQGALETLGIPYTGSGVMASALGDGQVAHQARLARERHADAALSRRRRGNRLDAASSRELGLPLIVKPAREGSTIGITKVTRVDQTSCEPPTSSRRSTTRSCWPRNSSSGVELTGVDRSTARALPLIRIEAPQGNYDYQNKYFTDDTQVPLPERPAGRRRNARSQAQSLARVRRRSAAAAGAALDLMLRDDGSRSFLEVNTSPGMTGHRLVPMAARQAGIVVRRPVRRDPGGRACGMTRAS